jgi:hypothetical protein
MTEDLRRRADERLESTLAETGELQDPRPFFRPVLRHLRNGDPSAFDRALSHFESTLIPGVAAGGDPVAAWLAYAELLAAALGPGRRVEVDASGRAHDLADLAGAGGLVLHIPDADDAPVLVMRCPARPSSAQNATVELLVAGRVTASEYQ